jgi:hypothetical protein
MPLYTDLEYIWSTVHDLNSHVSELNLELEKLGKFSKNYKPGLIAPVSEAEINGIMTESIGEYRENGILRERIMHDRKITDCLLELDSDMKGFRRFLPRRKDEAYNGRVDELVQLVPDSGYLRRCGLLSPDNFISGAVYSGVALGGVMYPLVRFTIKGLDGDAEDPEFINYVSKALTILGCGIGIPAGGALIQKSRMGRSDSVEQARQLDEVLSKLGEPLQGLYA